MSLNNHHYQEQNSHLANSRNSSNLRNSLVAPHQSHQGYAPNGSVLVNGSSDASGGRQLQGGGQSAAPGAISGTSQSGQSSQVNAMNHQTHKDENFDVSMNILGFINSSLLCLSLSLSLSTTTSLTHFFIIMYLPQSFTFSLLLVIYNTG